MVRSHCTLPHTVCVRWPGHMNHIFPYIDDRTSAQLHISSDRAVCRDRNTWRQTGASVHADTSAVLVEYISCTSPQFADCRRSRVRAFHRRTSVHSPTSPTRHIALSFDTSLYLWPTKNNGYGIQNPKF